MPCSRHNSLNKNVMSKYLQWERGLQVIRGYG